MYPGIVSKCRSASPKPSRLTREESGQIASSRDRVGGDVEEELNVDEAERDEGKTCSSLGRWVDVKHPVHDVDDIPDLFTELWGGRRSDTNTEEGGDDEARWQSDELRPYCGSRGLGSGREIGSIGDWTSQLDDNGDQTRRQ
jgi:hypothetical protein